MSVRVMERVWRYGPPHPNERLVLLCLADKAADDGRNAFPSMATIAERTALSQRTVERVIDRLVAAGYLLRERRYVGNGRRNRSNLYTIVLGRLEPNTVTVTVLNDANTVTMTPSNTVTVTGSASSPCAMPHKSLVLFLGSFRRGGGHRPHAHQFQ